MWKPIFGWVFLLNVSRIWDSWDQKFYLNFWNEYRYNEYMVVMAMYPETPIVSDLQKCGKNEFTIVRIIII